MTSSITAKNIIMTDVSTGEYLIPYTDKQDTISDLDTIRANASAVTDKADDSAVIHTSGAETAAGEKTFSDKIYAAGDLVVGTNDTVSEGGQIDIVPCKNSTLTSNIFIDNYDNYLRIFAATSSGSVAVPLQVDFDNSTIIGNLSGTATKATQDGSGNVITDTYLRVVNGSCSFSVTSLTSVSSQSITLSSTISAVKGWNLSCNDSGYNVNCDLSIGSSVSSISISLIKNNWNKVIDDKTVTVYYSIYY